MPKATQKTPCEQCTVEQVLPEEFSEQGETSFEQEADVDPEVIISPTSSYNKCIYTIYQGF